MFSPYTFGWCRDGEWFCRPVPDNFLDSILFIPVFWELLRPQ